MRLPSWKDWLIATGNTNHYDTNVRQVTNLIPPKSSNEEAFTKLSQAKGVIVLTYDSVQNIISEIVDAFELLCEFPVLPHRLRWSRAPWSEPKSDISFIFLESDKRIVGSNKSIKILVSLKNLVTSDLRTCLLFVENLRFVDPS